jgi:hypothetical protein
MSHQPGNISTGTQVVSLVEVRGTNNSLVHPRGAVGIVIHTPGASMVRSSPSHDVSQLPELPSDETRAALKDLLVRIRLNSQPFAAQ